MNRFFHLQNVRFIRVLRTRNRIVRSSQHCIRGPLADRVPAERGRDAGRTRAAEAHFNAQ